MLLSFARATSAAAAVALLASGCGAMLRGVDSRFAWDEDSGPKWPVRGTIVSAFRGGARPDHRGVDIASAAGTPVVASLSGVVSHSGVIQGWGKFVSIRHENGLATVYAHLRDVRVQEGIVIERGEAIGRVDEGEVLHFEVHGRTGAVDPEALYAGLPERSSTSDRVTSVEPDFEPRSELPVGRPQQPIAENPLRPPQSAPTDRFTSERDRAPEPEPLASFRRLGESGDDRPASETSSPEDDDLFDSTEPADTEVSETDPFDSDTPLDVAKPAPSRAPAKGSRRDEAIRPGGFLSDLEGLGTPEGQRDLALAVVASIGYIPAKLVYAGLGAAVGVASYVLTAGDGEASSEIFWAAVGGDYRVRPQHIAGTEPLRFIGSP